MKYYVLLGVVLAFMFGFYWLLSQTTEHNSMNKSKKEVVVESPKEIVLPHEIAGELLQTKTSEQKEVEPSQTEKHEPEIPTNILAEVRAYLKDDVIDLKIGMTKKEEDAMLGKPNSIIAMDFGPVWYYVESKKGIPYKKVIAFQDNKLLYWNKEVWIKGIKTHQRGDHYSENYLADDQSLTLFKGMNKTEVYSMWGIPYNIEVKCRNENEIFTEWWFKTNGNYTHMAEFKNNKLIKWKDIYLFLI